MKLLIRSASVVNSRTIKLQDVYISEGKIVEPFPKEEADRVIDASGKYLLPGAIDVHVHFREPGGSEKEDWEHGSRGAVLGGVTTVLEMPNTTPPTTSQKTLDEKKALVKGRSYANYGFFAGATEDIQALEKMKGMVGIKLYMGSSTGDLLLDQPDYWEKIFRIAKAKDIPVVVHAENEARIQKNMKRPRTGEAMDYAHVRDSECAREAVEMALELRKKIGNKLHIAHVSSKGELELLHAFKDPKVTCEVTPHHLFFTMEDMEDAFLKMNPPLRTIMDVEALWRGLLDGTVTCIATDHAPHTREEKEQDVWTAPAGVPGVEFVLPLMLNAVDEEKLTLERLVLLMCENPAKTFGLTSKGKIMLGMDADLVLVDMNVRKTVERKNVESKCGWSPYEYFDLKGWPVMTIVGGEVVAENGKCVGKANGQCLA